MALALALGAAACGKVNTFSDAGGDDDDDTVIDANGATTVTVTTYSRNGARAIVSGVDVVVTGADGAVRDQGITDAEGHVTLDAAVGDTVTAVYREVGGADIVSFLQVRPGDALTFGRDGFVDEPANATMTVSFGDVGASSYRIYHPCGTEYVYSPNLMGTIERRPSCATDTFDLFLVAFDSNSALIRYGKIAGTTFVDGETRTLAQWANPTAFTLSAIGLPPEVTTAELQATPMVNGRQSFSVRGSGTPVDGAFSQTVPWGATGGQVLAIGLFGRGGGFGQQGMLEPIAANATQWQAQNAVTLPWLANVVANSAARQIAWIVEGEGTYDATLAFAQWDHTETDGGVITSRWYFIGPPQMTSIDIPDLPGTLGQYAPQDNDYIQSAQVVLFDVVADDSYDQIRVRPEWEVLGLFGNTLPPSAVKLSISPFN